MSKGIKGVKAFKKDMTCQGFKFAEGETYTHEGEAKCCQSGFHFCENPLDVLNYYDLLNSEFHQVESLPDAKIDGVPGEELVAGKLFSIEYSPVESTLSVKGGDIRFNAPSTFRNSFTRIRKQYTAPGNMRNAKFTGAQFNIEHEGQKKSFVAWMDYLTRWRYIVQL